jgi:vacuolar protein sorting-associated protein 54
VDPSSFRPYLAQVGSLFEARARKEDEEQHSQWVRKEKSPAKEDDFADSLERRLRGEQQRPRPGSRQGSIATLSPIDSPQTQRRRLSGSTPRRPMAVTPLSTIPGVYFDENFHLENPRTFDIVSERSEVVRTPLSADDESKGANGFFANGAAPLPRKALATNAILQEKLSWYLDTVEIHLISSISAASKSFFAALGSLKDLHSEAAESVAKIKLLREDLSKLDKDMAIGGLEIVAMKQRRENLRKLSDAVKQLHNVVHGAAHCEDLVDQGELEIALDHISILEEYTCGRMRSNSSIDTTWLCSKPQRQLLDLRRLNALDGFAEGMDQLRARIGKGYETRFLEALLADLRHHITAVPHADTLKRWASASQRSRGGGHASGPSVVPAYLHTNGALRQNLSVILNGLSRSKSTVTASLAFRDAIMREMKNIVRQHMPSSGNDDAESIASISTNRSRVTSQQDKSARLAANLRALGPDDAEELLTNMYTGVGEGLRRLQTQVKMLLDVTSAQAMPSSGTKSPPRSPGMASLDASVTRARSNSTPLQVELMQALDLSSLLGTAVDAAQTQVTKILKVRTDQSTTLPLPQFLRYFTLNRLFADECEAVSGRSGAALKGVVNSHITDFISLMARAERDRMEDLIDKDRWEAKDFRDLDSTVLSQVLEGMSSDPGRWLSHIYIWEALPAYQSNGSAPGSLKPATNGNGTSGPTSTKEVAKPAVIEEERFTLVESTISLLHGISRFQILIACIPSISTEVSNQLIEYLRFFNSRACQMVLGAGATRSTAALKNINTKHLALASQALSFVITLIPYIREFVRRRPGMTGEKLAEYDRTKRLYQDHQVSINEKLVEIMSGRATAHVKAMRNIDFDVEAEKEKGKEEEAAKVSRHIETLTKETTVLHRTLSKYLPEMHVGMIMSPVFANYREQWGEAFKGAGVKTEGGKSRYVLPTRIDFPTQMLIDVTGYFAMQNTCTPSSVKSRDLVISASISLQLLRRKPLLRLENHQRHQSHPRRALRQKSKDQRPKATTRSQRRHRP